MKEIALLGATASGKSALSIQLAHETKSNILSLDSLSIYKEVDIASAKPTINERENIIHFGIDEFFINEYFSAATFFDIYKKAKEASKEENKNLIIVGGTSFYLKAMTDGLSPQIKPSNQTIEKTKKELLDIKHAYEYINSLDPIYSQKIERNDKFRMEKWFYIYFDTGLTATNYFRKHKKQSMIKDIKIFDILIERSILRERIALRTEEMLKQGIIDEAFYLESKYSRLPNPMKSIGIKESLDYLDGRINKNELKEKITINTAKLAKRQETFNKTQFSKIIKNTKEELFTQIKNYLLNNNY